MKKHEFRDGRPTDYITMSTGVEYHEFDEDDERVQEIFNYFNQVHTDEANREYQLMKFASYIDGNSVGEATFDFWTGSGCHGYNSEIMMYDGSFKKVQDIKIGERLMGDDSTPKTVQRLCRGKGTMYRITLGNDENYIVNSDHIICLALVPYSKTSEIQENSEIIMDDIIFQEIELSNFL